MYINTVTNIYATIIINIVAFRFSFSVTHKSNEYILFKNVNQ